MSVSMHNGAGKVLLFGEHAVVYGSPSIALGLTRGVRVTIKRSEENLLTIASWNTKVVPGEESELGRAYDRLLRAFRPKKSYTLALDVDLPAGAGLGCSAAISVALLRALNAQEKRDLSEQQIVDLSLEWEKEFHDNPSGVDSAASFWGGLIRYQKEKGIEEIFSACDFDLVVAHSGESSSTKTMVKGLADFRTANESFVNQGVARISEIVRDAEKALREGKVEELGLLMHRNHEVLRSLRLSTDKLDLLCERALNAKALGAKLTGSGGGGCMIALTKAGESSEVKCALEGHSQMVFVEERRSAQ